MQPVPWYKNKSNITAIAGGLTVIIANITGITLPAWFEEAVITLWAVFMRIGVSKSGPNGGGQ